MPSRGLAVLVVAMVVTAGGLLWRSVAGLGPDADPTLVRAVSALAGDATAPVSILSEDDRVDASLAAAATDAGAPLLQIVPREPRLIESAVRAGSLLAGPRGLDYLEVLGYRASWLPRSVTPSSLPLARVQDRFRCAAVTEHAWSPLPGLEYTGRLGVILPPVAGGTLLLVVGDVLPLDVHVTAVDGADVPVRREVLASLAAAPPDYWLESGSPRDVPPDIQQLTIFADPARERQLSVRLGRRAPRVLARLQDYPKLMHAAVCAAPSSSGEAFTGSDAYFAVLPPDNTHFGAGWSDALVRDDVGDVRWMGRHGALLVPFARRGSVRITLHAYRSPDLSDGEVSLRVNDTRDTPAQPLGEGLRRYEWTIPAAAWVTGTNEMLIRVSSEGNDRLLGLVRLDLSLGSQQ